MKEFTIDMNQGPSVFTRDLLKAAENLLESGEDPRAVLDFINTRSGFYLMDLDITDNKLN